MLYHDNDRTRTIALYHIETRLLWDAEYAHVGNDAEKKAWRVKKALEFKENEVASTSSIFFAVVSLIVVVKRIAACRGWFQNEAKKRQKQDARRRQQEAKKRRKQDARRTQDE